MSLYIGKENDCIYKESNYDAKKINWWKV